MIYTLGFNQNYYTFTLILLIKPFCALNSLELTLKFIQCECFEMRFVEAGVDFAVDQPDLPYIIHIWQRAYISYIYGRGRTHIVHIWQRAYIYHTYMAEDIHIS